MKIIYDSENNFENSEDGLLGSIRSEDVDISAPQTGAPPKKEAADTNMNVQPPFQQASQPMPPQGVPVQGAPPQGTPMQPVYGTTVPLTQEQFNFMMAQLAAMQASGAFPVQLQQQGEMPYGQVPYRPYVPYQPPQPQPPSDTAGGHNPGTRVLYQSADFDMAERKEPKQTYTQPPQPLYKQETDIEEENIQLGGTSFKSELQDSPFSVDETQMTMFEFDAMAKKMRMPEYKRTDAPSSTISEDEEEIFSNNEAAEPKKAKGKTAKGENDSKEKKSLPTSEIIRRAVLAVSLIAIVVAAGMLINEYRLSRQNNNVIDEVSGLIITEAKKPDNAEKEETTQRELTPEEQWAQLKAEYPNVVFPEGLQLKYAKLYATNQEFVGYLSADGVDINLPIVQANDDKKYLEKNFFLQNTKYGCPFVTHLNNITELDQNTVIFGHHMNNGTIFGALDKYKTIDGFKSAPLITFNTLYKDYSWKVIAAFVTNAYAKDDNGYIFRYYFTQLSTQENFAAYLSELSQRSLYDTGVDVLPTDKLLTLSTCSHEFTDARFVVVARLVRPGESTDVDVSRATVNADPRYPQAWYDKKGKNNTYKNAFQWEVS